MKKISIILSTIALGLCMAFAIPDNSIKPLRVVIDAGHGGHDHGADCDGLLEKELIGAIVEKIRTQHRNENIVLHYTRDSDRFVSLQDRVEMINEIKPDLVLSLHANKLARTEVSGMEFYISDKASTQERSRSVAEKLSEKFSKNHDFKTRKIATAPFFILKNSEAPAVTVELGFLSNSDDRKVLTDDNHQQQIAATIIEFLSEL